jgi:hypothetical protein
MLHPSAFCPPVPAACQNEAETGDIDRHQDDNETGPGQHLSS